MKLYPIIIIVVFLLCKVAITQEVIINENCKLAYEDILSLKIDNAENRIILEKKSNPDNLFIPYLENYIDFIKVTIGEDKSLYDSVQYKINIRTESIERLSDKSPYKKYLLGNINLQWATANFKFGNYFSGAVKINKAYRLLKNNDEQFDDFTPNSITLGILHIMIGLVPDSYTWVLNLISMEGSVDQGLEELRLAYTYCNETDDFTYLTDEILFYSGMVNLNLNPDPQFAEYFLNKIKKDEQESLLFTYLAINILMKNGRNAEALESFRNINTRISYYPFYYLNYLHGDCYIRCLDSEKAIPEFKKFLYDFKGINYIKDAWRKIAWSSIINYDTVGYDKAMHNVLIHGHAEIDADKSAMKEAERGVIPNIKLLKSRLLFDGGYYNKSLEILNSLSESILANIETVEKYYRLGRIYHQLKNYPEAIKYYKITIETGSAFPEYMAANSALKLGNIYEIKSDLTRSAHYYNMCLNIDFVEYRTSIRAKAKQGLKRVSNIK
jgi:tetratricopeptide (TPR) repeat protein